ncbi:MAG: class I SAM-dependent methyltransferase [Paludibacteraceae bacterium]|nr:class I SAM-dependent methyltransferase [Paludibacteraceae bacterium]
MGFLSKIFNNARKPEGFIGKMMVNGMNTGSHAAMSEWAFAKIGVPADGELLDIGCGGGANLARLLQRSKNAKVVGIDYSAVSVGKSLKFNSEAVEKGRCAVMEGNVSNLPFSDGQFQLVTAFETIYFWPDIEHCFKEVLRVLSQGAQFCIVNESDGNQPSDAKWSSIVEGMHPYKGEEIKTHLENAGFVDVQVSVDEKKHWLLAVARKSN